MSLNEKFNGQFLVKTVELDEEKEQLYVFDKNSMDDEKINALVESFNSLYNAEVMVCSFNEYLDQIGIEYIDLGTLEYSIN